MNWLIDLFTQESVAQTVLIYAITIAFGIWMGRVKLFGVSFGVTWVLFIGILLSYIGVTVNKEIEHFLRDFGLILFVYSIGLQVGPGFFASLKQKAAINNVLAASVVLLGIGITISLHFVTGNHIAILAGVMSGAVTNTPGLGAAQAAFKDLHIVGTDNSTITLAYAVAYPFGVFGIIFSLIILRKLLGINIEKEKERHRKLDVLRSGKPVSIHLNLENHQLFGQPLRRIFELLHEPIVVSRMLHHGEVITPTPDIILAEGDVLLVLTSKTQVDKVKIVIGSPTNINLKNAPDSNLISRQIIVTRQEVTHKRLGDLDEMHQHDFTLTRLNRAGIEMVTNGNIYLQLGDMVKVVGTEEGVERVTKALGNSLKRLDVPDLAPIFIGIALGVVLGSIPFQIANMPVAVKIGMAGGPLIVALLLSRYGSYMYLNNYTTNSANLMIRELGIALFLAGVGLGSGHNLSSAFSDGSGWNWIWMGICITMIPLLIVGVIANKFFKKTYFEICGLLAGASTDPPALAFALKMANSDIPSATYATVYPLTMILRIIGAQLLVLLFS